MTKIIAVTIDYKSKVHPSGVETIVVDNNKINRGFAAGANLGIKKAMSKQADKILLVNPDVVITKKQITKLASYSGDIVSPVLTFTRNGEKIRDHGGEVNYLLGRTSHFENKVGEIDFVSGACMMIDSRVFKKIGFFDENYFMYFEDVDFCLLARKNGFKIEVADLEVEHLIQEHKIIKNKEKSKYILVSNKEFIRKWIPIWFKPVAYSYLTALKLKTKFS